MVIKCKKIGIITQIITEMTVICSQEKGERLSGENIAGLGALVHRTTCLSLFKQTVSISKTNLG